MGIGTNNSVHSVILINGFGGDIPPCVFIAFISAVFPEGLTLGPGTYRASSMVLFLSSASLSHLEAARQEPRVV